MLPMTASLPRLLHPLTVPRRSSSCVLKQPLLARRGDRLLDAVQTTEVLSADDADGTQIYFFACAASSSASASSAWRFVSTFFQIFLIRPSGPIQNVVRAMPQ